MLQELGFARSLSVDDLLLKRRACLLALLHLLSALDPVRAPPPRDGYIYM